MMAATARTVAIVVVLLAAQFVIARQPMHAMPLRAPLRAFPVALPGLAGLTDIDIDSDTRRVLGADDYLERVYIADDAEPVDLYIAYYASQQQGDSIHSPLHCLPGSGWIPVAHRRIAIGSGAAAFPANEYVVENRGRRNVVLYWFEGRGRVEASEYWNTAYLMYDALRMHRTDGALVRLTSRATPSGSGSEPLRRVAALVHATLRSQLP
jgi:EpsI family protein